MRLLSCLLGPGALALDAWNNDTFKNDEVQSMSNLFRTISKFVPEPIDIEIDGLPEWIDGIFYRNGPLKYEYGNHTQPEFEHFFDPTGGLQAIKIKDGKMTYRSAITESSRYLTYQRDGLVNRPEVGTYREDPWVTTLFPGPDGEPLEEPSRPSDYPEYTAKVAANRMKFLIENQYATDNTNIAVFSLLGYLFSFTETTFINYHDPVTLETLGTFNLRKLVIRR